MNKLITKLSLWEASLEREYNLCTDEKEKIILHGQLRTYRMNSKYREGQLKKGVIPIFCKDCGSPDFLDWVEPVRSNLIREGVCHTCYTWKDRTKNNSKYIIIDNTLYTDSGWDNNNTQWNGYGGKVFHYKFYNSDKIHKTNNLFHGGSVPIRFRKGMLENNAEFITHDPKETI